jgi:membrane-associated phospholipid phosphatase
MLRWLAVLISIIFHPLLMLTYMVTLLLLANPYLFGVHDISEQTVLILLIFLTTVVIPGFSVVMMRLLGLIQSVQLEDRQDRIGPYIVTGVFYLWLFVRLLHDPVVPPVFSAFVLGSTIALFLAFFINLFSKISAHAVGMGGLLGMVIITMASYSYGSFIVDVGILGMFQMNMVMVLMITILLNGIVGTARLALDAHVMQDLYGGFMVGFLSQFVGALFLLGGL